jgi:Ion channel
MTLVATAVGIALIAIALRDVFDTLFHPHGRGVVSERLIRVVWRLLRTAFGRSPHLLSLAGPLAFLLVVMSWVVMVVVGAALIILPHLPEDYLFAGGLAPRSGISEAVYISLLNVTSLGYGDIVPTSDALRALGPLETMIGLGILTASISWILSIYRVLADYRSVAREIGLTCDAETSTGASLAKAEPAYVAGLLASLTSQLVAVRRDLQHFPIAYYFHSRDPRYELANELPRLVELLGRLGAERAPELALETARLRAASTDFLDTVDEEFLGKRGGTTDEIVARWRRDHLWD